MADDNAYLGAAKLRDVYHSGFCPQAVEQARGTAPDAGGASDRRYFLQHHINTCSECMTAMKWKNIEADVAERLGYGNDFRMGRDPYLQDPRFHLALQRAIKRAVATGFLTSNELEATKVIAQRRKDNRQPPFRPLRAGLFAETFKDGSTIYRCDTCCYHTPNKTCAICENPTRKLYHEAP